MEIPEYVTIEEVKRVCSELGIRDWTALAEPVVQTEEAALLLKEVNVQGMDIELEDFRLGLEVELEHGTRFEDANVTNNHPFITAKIVLAHMKETLDYYKRIEVMEIEGDLHHAILAGNLDRIASKYRKLVEARKILDESVSSQLK
ncbi:DUF5661 family protein [Thermodesulfobacteriota bacterium]